MTWRGLMAGIGTLGLAALAGAAGAGRAQEGAGPTPPNTAADPARPTAPAGLTAGYDFSAELGGFRIRQLAGLGTRADPIRLDKSVFTAHAVTLVIRANKPINPFADPGTHATGTLHFEITVENLSGLPWIGAEFELQEALGQPSIYGDGLSFDQRRIGHYPSRSDRFARSRKDFEPHDRILFHDGAVNPGQRVRFRFLVTDLTPAKVFYLRFDPRIAAS